MAKQKTWEELELKDDYLFAKVMRNPSICKELIEKLLGIAIEKIEYVEIQKPLDVSLNAKSVRLDVYVLDEKHTVYNVDYSDFCVIPINFTFTLHYKLFKQVYRNNFLVASQ